MAYPHCQIFCNITKTTLLLYQQRDLKEKWKLHGNERISPSQSQLVHPSYKVIKNTFQTYTEQCLVSSWTHLIAINSTSRLHLSELGWHIFSADHLTSLCISSTCFTTAVSNDFKDKAFDSESVCKFWSASSHCPSMYSSVPLEHYKETIQIWHIATSEHMYLFHKYTEPFASGTIKNERAEEMYSWNLISWPFKQKA